MSRHRRQSRKFPKRYCPLDYYLCTELNDQGQGVVLINNKPFFIDYLIPNEWAKIEIFYQYSDRGFGKAIKIKNPSPLRKLNLDHPKLSLGVYQIAHLTDQAQDDFKQSQVEKTFKQQVNPIIVKARTFYRNKVVLSDGGFKPPGKHRKFSIIPTVEQFDLMKLDWAKYQNFKGDLIIRRLDSEIAGRPGMNLFTTDHFLNKIFQVNLNAFYQVNSQMARLVYQQIIDFVDPQTVVFDLFAGAATIGICVSDKARQVYAVEINVQSYQDALVNIKLNHVNNVLVINDDANKWMIETKVQPDIIILDPARGGLSAQTCKIINRSSAKRIIYLSCNIKTQKRDIDILTNYKIKVIQPYDFFPQTYHIENLIILEKSE